MVKGSSLGSTSTITVSPHRQMANNCSTLRRMASSNYSSSSRMTSKGSLTNCCKCRIKAILIAPSSSKDYRIRSLSRKVEEATGRRSGQNPMTITHRVTQAPPKSNSNTHSSRTSCKNSSDSRRIKIRCLLIPVSNDWTLEAALAVKSFKSRHRQSHLK